MIDDFIGNLAAAGIHPVQAAQHKRRFVAYGGGEDAGIVRSQQYEGCGALVGGIEPAQQMVVLGPSILADADIAGGQGLDGHATVAQVLHDGILYGAQQFRRGLPVVRQADGSIISLSAISGMITSEFPDGLRVQLLSHVVFQAFPQAELAAGIIRNGMFSISGSSARSRHAAQSTDSSGLRSR